MCDHDTDHDHDTDEHKLELGGATKVGCCGTCVGAKRPGLKPEPGK